MMGQKGLILFLVYLLHNPGAESFKDCPIRCICSDGDTIVDCSNQGLLDVPTSLPSSTITLILRNNSITELDPNRLAVARHLTNLDVSHNLIQEISQPLQRNIPGLTVANFSQNKIAFLDRILCQLWPGLVDFDISNNSLSILKNRFFSNCRLLRKLNLAWNVLEGKSLLGVQYISALQHLDISGNKLPFLISKAFDGLPNLQYLKVSNAGTRLLFEDSFKGLISLQFLDLSFNDFSELDPLPFYRLKSLWVLNLLGIKFLCDCKLRSLKDWVVDNSIVLQGRVVCILPKASKIFDIRYTDMAQFCPPTTAPPIWALSSVPSSFCDNIAPKNMHITDVTNSSAVLNLEMDSSLPCSVVLRQISGASDIQATPFTRASKTYTFIELHYGMDYVACVEVRICAYEQCTIFRTLGSEGSDRKTTLTTMTDESQGAINLATAVSVSVIVTVIVFIVCIVGYMIYAKKLSLLYKIKKKQYSPSVSLNFQQSADTRLPATNAIPLTSVQPNAVQADAEPTLQISARNSRGSLYNNPSYTERRSEDDVIWGVSPENEANTQGQRPAGELPIGYASISTEDVSKPAFSVYEELLPEDKQRMTFAVSRSPGNRPRVPVPAESRTSVDSIEDDVFGDTDSENEEHYCRIDGGDDKAGHRSKSLHAGTESVEQENTPDHDSAKSNNSPTGGARGKDIQKDRENVLGGKSGTPHWKNFVPASMFEADNYENVARGEKVGPGPEPPYENV